MAYQHVAISTTVFTYNGSVFSRVLELFPLLRNGQTGLHIKMFLVSYKYKIQSSKSFPFFPGGRREECLTLIAK